MNQEINFYTCCNKIYNNFIPTFILSNLYHNENSLVEVGTDDLHYEPIKEAIKFLKKIYPDRFFIKEVNFNQVICENKSFKSIPNSIRFITPVTLQTNFVYISDVDIITLQKDICNIHKKNMERTKLPYSNIVRPLSNKPNEIKRLSGLHFTPYSNYYPIPDICELYHSGILNHDEGLLYKIVESRYKDFNYDEKYRPVHGIHISLNRQPTGNLGWGMDNWKNQWNDFRNSDVFLELEKLLPEFMREKINIIDNHYR